MGSHADLDKSCIFSFESQRVALGSCDPFWVLLVHSNFAKYFSLQKHFFQMELGVLKEIDTHMSSYRRSYFTELLIPLFLFVLIPLALTTMRRSSL